MHGIFKPVPRKLTEEQFASTMNGAHLSLEELYVLRRDCGLPYDKEAVSHLTMTDRVAAFAWQKIRGKP